MPTWISTITGRFHLFIPLSRLVLRLWVVSTAAHLRLWGPRLSIEGRCGSASQAERGWLDEHTCMTEALLSIARAGADVIFTYAAMDYARWWRENGSL